MALGVAAALSATLRGGQQRRALLSLSLCGGVLLATRSRAALLAAVVASATALLLHSARKWRRNAVAILTGGAAATVLAMLFLLATRPGLGVVDATIRSPGARVSGGACYAVASEQPLAWPRLWHLLVEPCRAGRWRSFRHR